MLVTLRERGDAYQADRFLTASDLDDKAENAAENADWKTVVLDEASGAPAVPNGSVGHRYEQGEGRWNLGLGEIEPALSLLGRHSKTVTVDLARFDVGPSEGGTTMRRGVPVMEVGGRLVTTVFDLLLANYGVAREGLLAIGRPATKTQGRPTRRTGRSRSPASKHGSRSRSRASSPAMRSKPAAAR